VGAKRAAKWFQNYLRALFDKLGEMKTRFSRESAGPVQILAGTDAAKSKGNKRTPQDLATAFVHYCRLRLFELASQRAGQIAHALQSHAVAAHDVMVDLQRDLNHLASQFPVPDDGELLPAKTTSAEVAAVRTSVAYQLRAAEES